MTDKRFKIVAIEEELYPMPIYYDNHKKKELEYNEVCDLLNELHDENMLLKGGMAHYKLMLMSLEKEAKRMSQIHCLGDLE